MARRLIKGVYRITVSTFAGEPAKQLDVEGYLVEGTPFAVARSGYRTNWDITHIPTGYCAGYARTRKISVAMIDWLLEQDVDWSFTRLTKALTKRLRAIPFRQRWAKELK